MSELDFEDTTRPWARVHVGRVAHYPKVYSLCFHLFRQGPHELVILNMASSARLIDFHSHSSGELSRLEWSDSVWEMCRWITREALGVSSIEVMPSICNIS